MLRITNNTNHEHITEMSPDHEKDVASKINQTIKMVVRLTYHSEVGLFGGSICLTNEVECPHSPPPRPPTTSFCSSGLSASECRL